MICANCGKTNPDSSDACEHCAKAAWQQVQPKKPNLVVSVGIGLLVYLAGCNVGLMLRHHPPTPAPPPATLQVDTRP